MRGRLIRCGVVATLAAAVSALLPTGPAAAVACPGSMSGSGTSGSPCLVTTQAELASISSDLGLTYQLANSITLTGTWSPIAPYPAGGGAPFTGVLDGNGYTIAGLRTTDTTAIGVGLFGVARGATVKNLHLTDVSVSGATAVGAIAGIGSGLTIHRVRVEGAVQATNQGAGGLVGYALDLIGGDPITSAVRVTETMADDVVISADEDAGGFAGVAAVYVIVENSLVSGSISATTTAAGFVGSTGLFADNSLSVATLTGDASVRGLAGSGADSDAALTFFDSTAAGTTSAGVTGDFARTPGQLKQLANYTGWDIGVGWVPASDVWGICQSPHVRTVPFLNWTLNASPCTLAPSGTPPTVTTGSATGETANGASLSGTVNANDDSTNVTFVTTSSAANAAARIGTSHTATPGTADGTSNTAVTAAVTGLQPNTTYYFWVAATNYWGTSTGSLGTFTTIDGPPPLVACTAYAWPGGTGTPADPYLVDTYVDLYQATQCPTASFRQREDVSLALIDNWTPIGDISTPFTGTYDGGRHQITGLAYSSTSGDYVGLFGATDGATIRNINALSGTVLGRTSVGGLVGRAMNTTISHVHSAVAVTGDPSARVSGSAAAFDIGGLVGWMYGGSITGSSSTGNVTATGDGVWSGNSVGGLVGKATNALITDSWAEGAVRGIIDVGGLAGILLGASSVSRSDASGAVGSTGTSTAGGLVGRLEDSEGSAPVVTDSFARGNVTATAGGAANGGLVGYVRAGTITRAYSTGSVSSTGSSSLSGGFVGSFAGVDATFADSFWDTTTSGKSDATSGGFTTGVTGETTANMTLLSTFTAAGWDIGESCAVTGATWGLCPTENGGYPFLPRAPEPGPTPDPTPSPQPNGGGGGSTTPAVTATTSTPAAEASADQGAPAALPPGRPLAPGRTIAVRNGEPAEASARAGSTPNSMRLDGPGFTSEFTGVFRPATSSRAKGFAPAVLPSRVMTITGAGAQPGSAVALYLFSTPTLLTTITADGAGRFQGSFSVPAATPRGDHALQLALRNTSGDIVNASIGMLVTARAVGTFSTTVGFTGSSTELSKSARSELARFARTLRNTRDIALTCTSIITRAKPGRAEQRIAHARANAVCGFLDEASIRHVDSARTATRTIRGAAPGGVRVTTTGTIT